MLKITIRRTGVVALFMVLIALMATALTAQEGTVRPINPQARPVVDVIPVGDVVDTIPYFGIVYEPGVTENVTWFNIRVNDGNTVLLDEWYEVAEACQTEAMSAVCYAVPGVNLHPGLGDKALTWTLSEYDSVTEDVTEVDTYDFTIKAAVPVGPTTFSDPSGSPQFQLEAIGELLFYRLYVINADTNALVFDEWVEIDEVSCEGEPCIVTLNPPMAPIYESGDYTLYTQGYFPIPEAYSAWSEPFDFTVDYSELPEAGPTVILDAITEWVAIGDFFNQIEFDGEICNESESGLVSCTTTTPALFFVVLDHDLGGVPIAPDQQRDVSGADVEDYPIINATQWINVIVEDDSDTEIYNEWIDTYSYENCANFIGFDILRTDVPSNIPPGGLCAVFLPELAAGDYTLSYATYNPGGISEPEVIDLTITGEPSLVDTETDMTPDTSVVEVEVNDVFVELLFVDEDYFPRWVHYIVTDTSDDSVVYDEWVPTIDYLTFELQFIEAIIEAGGDFDSIDVYALYEGITACGFGDCEALLSWNPVNGDYELVVETWVGGDVSAPSDPIAFSIDNGVPTIVVESLNVLRMFDLAGDTRPTYEWVATANASWHNIQVEDDDGTMLVDDWFRWGNFCTDSFPESEAGEVLCEYQPESVLVPGDYTWRVRAWGSGGLGNFTADQTLTISDAALTTPVILDPVSEGNPHGNVPNFVFEPSANGSWYQIQVTNTGDNTLVYDEWIYFPLSWCDPMGTNQCVIDWDDVDASFELLDGAYSWRVRGANGSSLSNWTSAEAFTVEGEELGVELLSPILDLEYSIYETSPTFYWEARPSNDWYNLIVWRVNVEEFLIAGEDLTSREQLGEPAFSQWFNEASLGDDCDVTSPISIGRQVAPPDFPLPPYYCEYTIPDLGTGYYVWVVDAWGPTYGDEILSPVPSFATGFYEEFSIP